MACVSIGNKEDSKRIYCKEQVMAGASVSLVCKALEGQSECVRGTIVSAKALGRRKGTCSEALVAQRHLKGKRECSEALVLKGT
ncbi:hypothetical protein D5086_032570 [Populus alba]|uniref:Uncharacterized protein n=1 Tax=Populus alba TaxID=43335 RepID=A0ACC4ALW6_POPAL